MPEMLRLPRGATLVAERAELSRSFAVGFWFPWGSRHEKPEERGFVHFVEHMAFKGTSRRSAAELSREVDRVGGYINAFTDRDSLCLHCLVPASEWRFALDIVADMAFASTFEEEDFSRERDVVVSEILTALDDPEDSAHDEFLAAIWPGDPASRKIAGESSEVERIRRDSLYDFYSRAISPSCLLAAAAGPMDPAEVAEELGRIVEAAPGCASTPARVQAGPGEARAVSAALAPRMAATPRFKAARSFRRASIGQVHYFEAVQLEPPFGASDYYDLAALNGVLGEASSSRLFQALRERGGLCYSVYSAFSLERTECLWLAQANVSLATLPELAMRLSRELDEAAAKGLSESECLDAASRLAGSFEIALDDPDFRMRRLARQAMFDGQALDVDETRARIASVGPASINAMRERLLEGKERARFAYGKWSARAARALGLEDAGEVRRE